MFHGSRLRGVELVDVEISGELQTLNEERQHRLYAERDLTALEKED